MTQERKSIKFDVVTYERLKYIASMLDMSLSRFLRQLASQLFDVANEFETGNVFYDSYGNTLRVEFTGKSKLITGSMQLPTSLSDEAVDVAIAEKVEAEIKRRQENV